jgi:hypothetical protein
MRVSTPKYLFSEKGPTLEFGMASHSPKRFGAVFCVRAHRWEGLQPTGAPSQRDFDQFEQDHVRPGPNLTKYYVK